MTAGGFYVCHATGLNPSTSFHHAARPFGEMSSDKRVKSLATIGFEIVQLFSALENVTIKPFPGIETDDIIKQQQLFNLRATNIDLYEKGHASLDYQYRDTSGLYQYCRTLLGGLLETLKDCKYQTRS